MQNDLGDFLRVRRDSIQPADVGLPTHGLRRVPGLRREEVAILAGVSTDYYVKLEQGRSAGASNSVLDAIANVLRLNTTERAHLRHLVRPVVTTGFAGQKIVPPRVRHSILRLVESIPDVPAVVIGATFNQLAWNGLADALFGIAAMEEAGTTSVHQIFLDPAARVMYPDWSTVATEVVGYLRFNAGRDPDDSALRMLVAELSVKSYEFHSMWKQQTVRDKTFGRKLVHHPVAGTLDLNFETFRLPDDGSHSLITYTADAGSPTAEQLRLLASWVAPPHTKSAARSIDYGRTGSSDPGANPDSED